MSQTLRVWRQFGSSLVLAFCLPVAAHAEGSGPSTAPDPAPAADVEYDKGLRAKATKRYTEATSDFRRAVALRPNFAEAWNELGFALRQTGQYAEALKAYDQALRIRPNFPEAMEYLGEAYVKLGRMDEARAVLKRLTPLDQENKRMNAGDAKINRDDRRMREK